MQYEGAYDTTTGSSYDPSDFLTTMEGVDPYGEEPERSKKIVETYNAEMETIMAALNLEYPRYYTTPEWDAFRHEAIEWLADHKQEMNETVIEVQTHGGAVV
jgi:molecular chaperone GrpE (heat shock protein)